MSIISIVCVDQSLKIVNSPLITAGDENEDYVQFSFCSSWNGYAKVAIFYKNKAELHYSIVGNDNRCTIPNSLLIDEGVLCIGVVGFKNDGSTYKTRTTEVLRYNIAEGALQGESIEDPTLAALFYKQIENAEINEDKHLLIHLMDGTTIDAGEVGGGGITDIYDFYLVGNVTYDGEHNIFEDATLATGDDAYSFSTTKTMEEIVAAFDTGVPNIQGIFRQNMEVDNEGTLLKTTATAPMTVRPQWANKAYIEALLGGADTASEAGGIILDTQLDWVDLDKEASVRGKWRTMFIIYYSNTQNKIVCLNAGQ